MSNYFTIEDEILLKKEVRENIKHLKVSFGLTEEDIDIFYDNVFNIYDYAKIKFSAKHGQVLMYVTHAMSELQIANLNNSMDKLLEKKYCREQMIFTLAPFTDATCRYYASKLLPNR